MMNVTTDLGRQNHHPRATSYDVDDNGVLTLRDESDKAVAVYAAGSWSHVDLDQPPR